MIGGEAMTLFGGGMTAAAAVAGIACFSSRREADFQNRLLSAMRVESGGHVAKNGSTSR